MSVVCSLNPKCLARNSSIFSFPSLHRNPLASKNVLPVGPTLINVGEWVLKVLLGQPGTGSLPVPLRLLAPARRFLMQAVDRGRLWKPGISPGGREPLGAREEMFPPGCDSSFGDVSRYSGAVSLVVKRVEYY